MVARLHVSGQSVTYTMESELVIRLTHTHTQRAILPGYVPVEDGGGVSEEGIEAERALQVLQVQRFGQLEAGRGSNAILLRGHKETEPIPDPAGLSLHKDNTQRRGRVWVRKLDGRRNMTTT